QGNIPSSWMPNAVNPRLSALMYSRKYLLLRDLPRHDVVHPTRVDARGHFLSNFLSHHVRRVQRREASEGPAEGDRVYYQLWHGGHSLHFNLSLNPRLLAPGFLTERRYGGLDGARIRPAGSSQCHFLGEVRDEVTGKGSAAISTCDGLTGLFSLSHEEFFIRPLERSSEDTSAPHRIWCRYSPAVMLRFCLSSPDSHQGSLDTERQRERWEHRQQRRRRRIRQRSVSKEKWVETLVVADHKMVEHHGSKAVESYVLAVMNIVAGLFRDASIGNAINIVVVRLILLEQEEEDLKITHHADNSLNSFCKWQKKLNMKGEEQPLHHDVAVLLTRKDICAAVNAPCATLGLSHVAGMCQSHRSCSISEDTGLPLAFTVAHELGHNFGIQHDGNGNDCEPIGKRPFVMSPQLLYGTSLPRWSRCSRQYITRFLDRGWGWCLDDAPVKGKLQPDSVLPGVLYSSAHQCRLQYGSGSVLCDDMDDVCSTLWCTVGATCHSKLDGAVDGTSCGDDKWCFGGECVAVGSEPESVDGGWAAWSEWLACSRTCGVGVRSAHRHCENPVPKHGGKYCLGERRRYKICNNAPCPRDLPTFRDLQCRHFNGVPHKGKFYEWEAVINRGDPCELHCRPLDEDFSEKLQEAVADGTPCHEGNKSRDVCVNGVCKNLGCDYVIDSGAVVDRCGVCHGNGSTCTTVRRTFEETEGLGYVDIGLIPEAAWDIRIEEVAEAENFLALRSDNPNKYFLNGGWTIQWNGEYKAAGTVFTYKRTGHLENLTSPGPTMEPLWIQLLFQESNPGVRYEYTISRNASEDDNGSASVFFWKHGSWTQCSITCGTGRKIHRGRQIVHCVEKTTGIVEEHFCDPGTRPDDNQTICSKEPCPAMWRVGEWQKCSASCGSSGVTKRTVLCMRAVSAEEQKALEAGHCEHVPAPQSLSSCNTHLPCPADWSVASWSKCSLTCGSGVRRRNVTCSRNTGVDCDPEKKPPAASRDLGTTSPPSSEASAHLAVPFPHISGNRGASYGSAPTSGTEIIPPTSPEGAARPAAADEPPAAGKPTQAASTEGTAASSTSPAPNEMALLPMARRSSTSSSTDPAPSSQLPTNAATAPQRGATTAPAGPISLTHRPGPAPTAAYAQDTTAAYWVTGKWSAVSLRQCTSHILVVSLDGGTAHSCFLLIFCSTSCGLGAIWRTLACSTGPDSDCDPAKRPAPAQRCYLRPCSTWKLEEWGKCSRSCGSGLKSREVQCFDLRDRRPLRPFHCRAVSSRPQTQMSCNIQPCLEWYTSSWGQCSEVCGGGEQQRLVTCPEEEQCDVDLQPSNIQSCNSQPCAQWLTGSWGQCSASCGGGVRRRLIKCVNTKAETDDDLDPAQCDRELQPEGTQKCNLQECKSAPSVCRRDRLTVRFCLSLRWLDRCQLPNVRAQCCKTCGQRSLASQRHQKLNRLKQTGKKPF
uniref:ADAM metallopeptidase with thrombospondin type 1 motif 7 n=1 Tax=Gasterosteus aculeatus aculeatus TaxID=481459 RepID=A0AAQ4RXU0_GASAC